MWIRRPRCRRGRTRPSVSAPDRHSKCGHRFRTMLPRRGRPPRIRPRWQCHEGLRHAGSVSIGIPGTFPPTPTRAFSIYVSQRPLSGHLPLWRQCLVPTTIDTVGGVGNSRHDPSSTWSAAISRMGSGRHAHDMSGPVIIVISGNLDVESGASIVVKSGARADHRRRLHHPSGQP